MSPWTSVAKPSTQGWTADNPPGKEQYDQTDLFYDEPSVFYDGGNPAAWTSVTKPVSSTWTKVLKPS